MHNVYDGSYPRALCSLEILGDFVRFFLWIVTNLRVSHYCTAKPIKFLSLTIH